MDNASVWRAKGPGIESHCGQEFFILKFSLLSRAAQHDNAIANEINCGIHLANTLFSLGNSLYLLVHLSFKLDILHTINGICFKLDRDIDSLGLFVDMDVFLSNT